MMEHLTECAICGVTLDYESKSKVCDAHLPLANLQLMVECGMLSDFYGPPYFDDMMLTTHKDELRRHGFFISERGYLIEADDLARKRWQMWDHGYRGEDDDKHRGRAA